MGFSLAKTIQLLGYPHYELETPISEQRLIQQDFFTGSKNGQDATENQDDDTNAPRGKHKGARPLGESKHNNEKNGKRNERKFKFSSK